MFGNFSKSGKGRIEEDTELRELDEFGNPKQTKAEKQGNMQQSTGQSGRGLKGTLSSKGSYLFVLVFILFIFLHFTGNLNGFYDVFSSTPDENLNAMLNGVRDTEKVNKQEGKWNPIYDENNIYKDNALLKQVDKEYVVYIYSGDATLDKPFNKWVLANQKEIPIYKLNTWTIENPELNDLLGGSEPAFLLIREEGKDFKIVDKMIRDEAEFKNIPTILEALKKYRWSARENQ